MKISFVQYLVSSGGYQSVRQDAGVSPQYLFALLKQNKCFPVVERMKDRTMSHEGSDDTSVDKQTLDFIDCNLTGLF